MGNPVPQALVSHAYTAAINPSPWVCENVFSSHTHALGYHSSRAVPALKTNRHSRGGRQWEVLTAPYYNCTSATSNWLEFLTLQIMEEVLQIILEKDLFVVTMHDR